MPFSALQGPLPLAYRIVFYIIVIGHCRRNRRHALPGSRKKPGILSLYKTLLYHLGTCSETGVEWLSSWRERWSPGQAGKRGDWQFSQWKRTRPWAMTAAYFFFFAVSSLR